MRIKRRREYKWWISKEPLRTSGVKPDVPGKPPGGRGARSSPVFRTMPVS